MVFEVFGRGSARCAAARGGPVAPKSGINLVDLGGRHLKMPETSSGFRAEGRE